MTTEAEAVAELAHKAAHKSHVIKTADEREFLIVPNDWKHHDVTPANKFPPYLPEHISQHVTVQTTDSLVEYCQRYKTGETVLFADIATNTIVCQVDYHEPHGSNAAYVAHRATLTLAHSIEWKEWNKISGELMGQLEFARFIEENAADVRAPSGADLLESIRDLQAHRKVNFEKAVRTSSDNETFMYSEETQAKTRQGGIEIPTKFQLGIPVYFGEGDSEMFAFLRWRLEGGSLTLGIQLHRPEHVRQAVFKGIVTAIAERTECMAVFGKI